MLCGQPPTENGQQSPLDLVYSFQTSSVAQSALSTQHFIKHLYKYATMKVQVKLCSPYLKIFLTEAE